MAGNGYRVYLGDDEGVLMIMSMVAFSVNIQKTNVLYTLNK